MGPSLEVADGNIGTASPPGEVLGHVQFGAQIGQDPPTVVIAKRIGEREKHWSHGLSKGLGDRNLCILIPVLAPTSLGQV